jgi:predicted dinucleotide-binding enzyme
MTVDNWMIDEVAIENSRGPATLASLTEELGPSVVSQSLQDAYEAEMIFLAASRGINSGRS